MQFIPIDTGESQRYVDCGCGAVVSSAGPEPMPYKHHGADCRELSHDANCKAKADELALPGLAGAFKVHVGSVSLAPGQSS
jgi:hypothetical protein